MCRDLFADALTTLFRNISQNPIEMNFRLLTLFPRAVLHLPTRSGKNKRVQSARILNDRLKRWISGEHYFLWSETKREADKYLEHKKFTNTKNNIDRAINLTQEGHFGKACKSLLSNGMADASQDIISTLQDKHPKRLHPIDIPSTQTNSSIQFTTKEVMFMLDSFPVASDAGPSKLSPDHLREALRGITPMKQEYLIKAITDTVNLLAAGKVNHNIAQYFCGANLYPLKKKDGGIRPISVGETLRRLVSKCLNALVKKEAEMLFSPTQLGVGVKGGCEIIVHSVRSLIDIHSSSNDKCLLKIDFKNAFNLIYRESIISQVAKYFPGLLNWTLFTLLPESKLFIGNEFILSSRGVQQGDPLGPLLFSLALKKLTDTITTKFPNLNLSLFYLNDGIIIGNINEVKSTLDTILHVSSDLGLEINISKCEIWWPNFNYISWDIFPNSINKIYGEGINLLGSSIGTSKYINNHMDIKVNDYIKLQVILQMDNPQCELPLFVHAQVFVTLTMLLELPLLNPYITRLINMITL